VARVAGNLALGIARKKGRPLPHVVGPTDDATSVVDDRRLLVDTLRALPAGQRDTLLLRYVADLPEAEVARLLGCSVGTVKSQAHRALRRLRPELATDDDATDTTDPIRPLEPRSL
jgi:RNA polymerase sigma factor (sigma-70 family)